MFHRGWIVLPSAEVVCGCFEVMDRLTRRQLEHEQPCDEDEEEQKVACRNELFTKWLSAMSFKCTIDGHGMQCTLSSPVSCGFTSWVQSGVLHDDFRERAMKKLHNSEQARELLFWSFPDQKDWAIVMPNRIRRVLKAAFLCFRRFVKLDKHLRWRLTSEIVVLVKKPDAVPNAFVF
jgi:hypothetical protein